MWAHLHGGVNCSVVGQASLVNTGRLSDRFEG